MTGATGSQVCCNRRSTSLKAEGPADLIAHIWGTAVVAMTKTHLIFQTSSQSLGLVARYKRPTSQSIKHDRYIGARNRYDMTYVYDTVTDIGGADTQLYIFLCRLAVGTLKTHSREDKALGG